MTRTECCFDRPPRERIDEILKNRKHNVAHQYLRYEARRDYLQLCCEIDYLRAEAALSTPRITREQADELFALLLSCDAIIHMVSKTHPSVVQRKHCRELHSRLAKTMDETGTHELGIAVDPPTEKK